jgi:hypothetical protein
MPVLVMLSWILLLLMLVFKLPPTVPFEIAFVSLIFFTLHGNLAPLVEVIAAALREGQKKLILLIWLLLISYLLNAVISSVAIAELLFDKITRRNSNRWRKTIHNGDYDLDMKT